MWVKTVVFRDSFEHSFENNTFRSFGDVFFCRHNTDAVALQDCPVRGLVKPITCESVELPDQDDIELLFGAVADHLLELRPIVSTRALSAVDVCRHNGYVVMVSKFFTLTQLTLNAFISLPVA